MPVRRIVTSREGYVQLKKLTWSRRDLRVSGYQRKCS